MDATLNTGKSHNSVETIGKLWDLSTSKDKRVGTVAEIVELRYRKRHGWQQRTVAYEVMLRSAPVKRIQVDEYPNTATAFAACMEFARFWEQDYK